jgi:polyisoprenoid-binding protein YceI
MRPGGAFEAKTTSLSGTLTLGASKPALLKGEISVDLATIDTGIGLRNQHLREKYLEVPRGRGFDKAVLSEVRLDQADGEGFQGKTGFAGKLLLHGTSRDVAGTAEIRREGSEARVDASFPLTLTDFGIEPPEYLGVGVANKLLVKVRFSATPGSAR